MSHPIIFPFLSFYLLGVAGVEHWLIGRLVIGRI